MAKHTPGPWVVYDQAVDDGPTCGCHIISLADKLADWIAQDIYNRADARLIAAAPELLDLVRAYSGTVKPVTLAKLDKLAQALLARIDGGHSEAAS